VLQQFIDHIDRNKLFNKDDRILLAISGGLDSMVMLHLFSEARLSFGVAHCNFQLRGQEADDDEALVRDACTKGNIPFYVTHFDTQGYAQAHGISIQMAARSLRYDFFEALRKEHRYNYIATAHHINDHIETVFLNLIRGTGIDDLTGIAVKHNHMVRPLRFAARTEIEAYASTVHVAWREDSSNASNKYYRNLLRNEVIPILRKMNPALEETFKETSDRLLGTASLQHVALENFRQLHCRETADELLIDQHQLTSMEYPQVVLWELIKDRGFNFIQCKEIASGIHQSGKVFYSNSHKLIIDRKSLIVTLKADVTNEEVLLDDNNDLYSLGSDVMQGKKISIDAFVLTRIVSTAQLDTALLTFPLRWRRWKPGDQFIPLGMKQHKKLSDFLIDAKVSLSDKEKITVLESGSEIVWVVGHRIDDRFKITTSSKEVLMLTVNSKVSV